MNRGRRGADTGSMLRWSTLIAEALCIFLLAAALITMLQPDPVLELFGAG